MDGAGMSYEAGLRKRPQMKPNTRDKRQSRVCFRRPFQNGDNRCYAERPNPNLTDGQRTSHDENSRNTQIFLAQTPAAQRFGHIFSTTGRDRAGPREWRSRVRTRFEVLVQQLWLLS